MMRNKHYRLIPRLTRRLKFTLAQSSNQPVLSVPKIHAHIMLTQVNIKDGLKAYGNKGDEAILKELRQLRTRQALMPCNNDEMSYDESFTT